MLGSEERVGEVGDLQWFSCFPSGPVLSPAPLAAWGQPSADRHVKIWEKILPSGTGKRAAHYLKGWSGGGGGIILSLVSLSALLQRQAQSSQTEVRDSSEGKLERTWSV